MYNKIDVVSTSEVSNDTKDKLRTQEEQEMSLSLDTTMDTSISSSLTR
jgi:hypothetical protein